VVAGRRLNPARLQERGKLGAFEHVVLGREVVGEGAPARVGACSEMVGQWVWLHGFQSALGSRGHYRAAIPAAIDVVGFCLRHPAIMTQPGREEKLVQGQRLLWRRAAPSSWLAAG